MEEKPKKRKVNNYGMGYVKPPSEEEQRKIKLSLSIPLNEPFNKCPAKNHTFFVNLYRKGDRAEIEEKICPECIERIDAWFKEMEGLEDTFPPEQDIFKSMPKGSKQKSCKRCRCRHIAGWGTSHYGSGWCFRHEKGSRTKHAKHIAEEHKLAQRTVTDMVYYDPENWLEKTRMESESSRANIELRHEMDAVRGVIQEIMDKCRVDEKDSEYKQPILDLIEAINGAQMVDVEQGIQIQDFLDKIYEAVTTPLTGKDGKPMTDEARAKLIFDGAKTLSKLAVDKLNMDTTKTIIYDDFKSYMHQLWKVFLGFIEPDKQSEFLKKVSAIPEPEPKVK